MEKGTITIFNIEDFRTIVAECVNEALAPFKIVSEQKSSDNPNKDELLTRAETARLLRISLPTLGLYTKEGKLQSFRMGSVIRYKKNAVEAAVKEISFSKHKKK